MQLLPNEQILNHFKGNKNEFILTNLRVIDKYNFWWNSYTCYIFLEDISSIEMQHRENVLLLILGVLVLLGGLFIIESFETAAIPVIILGCILIFIWWNTRHSAIRIYPNGGKGINTIIKKDSDVANLLLNIQLAKMNRVNQVYKSTF